MREDILLLGVENELIRLFREKNENGSYTFGIQIESEDLNSIRYATLKETLAVLQIELAYGERVYINPEFSNHIDAGCASEFRVLDALEDFVPSPFSMNLH
jgi:hypothetical protein